MSSCDELRAVHRRAWALKADTLNAKALKCEAQQIASLICRVGEIVRILRTAAPNAHVLLQAVLPRGAAWVGMAQWQWPNRFSKPIEAINTRFQVGLSLT